MRTPKHGIRGKLESWSSKKYRAAKSITPFLELAMAAYFVVAIGVAIDHGHYMSMPFLALFLCGFGYVGWVSLWQGGFGLAVRGAFAPPRRHRGRRRRRRVRRGAAARVHRAPIPSWPAAASAGLAATRCDARPRRAWRDASARGARALGD